MGGGGAHQQHSTVLLEVLHVASATALLYVALSGIMTLIMFAFSAGSGPYNVLRRQGEGGGGG